MLREVKWLTWSPPMCGQAWTGSTFPDHSSSVLYTGLVPLREEDKVLVKGKGDEFKGTSKSTLPRVPMVCSRSMVESMCTYMSVYMYRFIRVWDAHKTEVSTFLALETTWKSALGLGPGELSGPEKGHQIPTLFLCSTLGDYSFPLTNPKDLELSRKGLSNTTSPSWQRFWLAQTSSAAAVLIPKPPDLKWWIWHL